MSDVYDDVWTIARTGHQPRRSGLMTQAAAWRVLEMFRDWDVGQSSQSWRDRGEATTEDRVYFERRMLLIAAMQALNYPLAETA